jgi:hypothetical protein
MKTNFLFIFLFINSTVFAQQQTRIYKTAEDFKIGKLSFNSSTTKVKLHHFFSKNYVDVVSNEKTIRFCKDSIFGYHNANGDFRFYKNNEKEFKILEAKAS